MRFEVTAHLEYIVKFPSTLIFNIHAQRHHGQTVLQEQFAVEPYVKAEEFVLEDGGNRFVRLETGRKKRLVVDYSATVDCSYDIIPASEIDPMPVSAIDRKAIPFLFPSRYCQSDRLGRLAWDLFGTIANPYEKVIAIVDWIHANVEYVRGSTDSETSAYDTVAQRTGVCRDFAHLGISLCRALNIPARYFSGYAYQLQPPDFHACFESYVGGHWLVFDASGSLERPGAYRLRPRRFRCRRRQHLRPCPGNRGAGRLPACPRSKVHAPCTEAPGQQGNFPESTP